MERDSHDPLQHLLDDLDGDDLDDPALDPRVEAVLLAMHERLTEPPDEVTRHRHLAEARRTARRTRRARRAGSLGRLSAVAAVLVLVLATVGLLPATLQQTVADAATLVGITLPTPGPTPAGEELPAETPQISEIGDVGGTPSSGTEDAEETEASQESSAEQPGHGPRTAVDAAAATPDPAQLPPAASGRAREALAEAAEAGQGPDGAADQARAGNRPGQVPEHIPAPPAHARAQGAAPAPGSQDTASADPSQHPSASAPGVRDREPRGVAAGRAADRPAPAAPQRGGPDGSPGRGNRG
jgi:hypothetical protein